VALGDCAAATSEQRALAAQVFEARPDYVVLTGDIVYQSGLASEYLDHFFPVYNSEADDRNAGAPLLRSIPFYAAPGNHDLIISDLDRHPDALAYYYYWVQPLNGPLTESGRHGATPLTGSARDQSAFRAAAGIAYPRMASFSFDRGPIHWTVLDSNDYVDWTDPALRAWLEADLHGPAARRAAWRIVAFHHPPFHGSRAHASEQQMRVLAPVFEEAGVELVLSGHVHNYQRSRPLKFTPTLDPRRGTPVGQASQIDGRWALDRSFDGDTHTRPGGVIYIVTGGGGARLYDTDQNDRPQTWPEFTARFVSDVHSFSVVDVTADALSLRQISVEGTELDRIVITH
jgi:3',5'-cyclic AMP phosphodiesterase CpdA